MAKTLSYADAVRILGGGPQSAVFQSINNLTGGLLLGAAVTAPALLGLIDARMELARISGELITKLSGRLTGASRRQRTERLAAAHTVVVITAYFDTIAGVGLPIDLARARLSRDDQLRMASSGLHEGRDLATVALSVGVALPEPHVSHDQYEKQLGNFYARMSDNLLRFLSGLAEWDHLSVGQRQLLTEKLAACAPRAQQRYDELLLDLMTDCPDVALWVTKRNQQALGRAVDELEPSLRELHRLLAPMAARSGSEDVTEALRRAYTALLGRRILEATDLPDGLDVPVLEQAYLPPAFQVAEADADRSAADESFWAEVEPREDLDRFLAGHLLSPRAERAPMLVLGQPGAGKSVLTRVLAARLSDTEFLPIRVPLRDVDSSLDLQRQIEQAILAATTEETTWPALVRSAGALPVVIIDGFDELLQATETSQTDYLYRVADFQRREREQNRAVAVIVTSRTSVADRAATPPETLLLRLQPFDETRIRAWVHTWNQLNETGLRERQCAPLAADAVLAHPDLASQPLLLFLLALYDADGNALQRGPSGPLTRGDLFEQLLTGFARREVGKSDPHLSPTQLEMRVEQELDRLSVVAFAMVNRSAQWATETAVDLDLEATLGDPGAGPARRPDADALSQSELIFGRFFFVHRAQAIRGGARRRTYEFLHATFGEYLVARFTWRLLAEAVAHDSVTRGSRPSAGNDLLADLLSFAALTVRASTVQFLGGMAARLSADERSRWTAVIVRRFRRSRRGAGGAAPAYQPVPAMNAAARFAAYSANLTLLATVVSGGLRFGDLVGPGEVHPSRLWHDQALLWHSQLLDEGWDTIAQTFAVERCVNSDGERDIRLTVDDGSWALPAIDPHWVFGRPEDERGRYAYTDGQPVDNQRRRIHFQTGLNDDILQHAVAPLLDSVLSPSIRMFVSWWPDAYPSAAQALISVWLSPITGLGRTEIDKAYRRCTMIATNDFPPWDDETHTAYAVQLLGALSAHHEVPAKTAAYVLEKLAALDEPPLLEPLLQTATTVLDRVSDDEDGVAAVVRLVLRTVERHGEQIRDPAVVVRHVIAAKARHRSEPAPPATPATSAGSGPANLGDLRNELVAFQARLAALRAELADRRAEINGVSREFDQVTAGSTTLRTAALALGQARQAYDDAEAALEYTGERIGAWVADHP